MTSGLPNDRHAIAEELSDYAPDNEDEQEMLRELGELADLEDPFDRSLPLHFTASALVVHLPTARVLLRWHPNFGRWMQVGGHGDAGESSLYGVARREAIEESGLPDLVGFPDPARASIVQVCIVEVAGNDREPAHRHGDVRYLFSTEHPDSIRAESPDAALRWCGFTEAMELVEEENLRTHLERAAGLITPRDEERTR